MALIFYNDTTRSIWNTLEFDCISRDFAYEGYEARAKLSGHVSALVSKESYRMLAAIFFNEMVDSYEKRPVHSVMDNTQVS